MRQTRAQYPGATLGGQAGHYPTPLKSKHIIKSRLKSSENHPKWSPKHPKNSPFKKPQSSAPPRDPHLIQSIPRESREPLGGRPATHGAARATADVQDAGVPGIQGIQGIQLWLRAIGYLGIWSGKYRRWCWFFLWFDGIWMLVQRILWFNGIEPSNLNYYNSIVTILWIYDDFSSNI